MKEYKQALKEHLKEVKDTIVVFPKLGKITLEYDCESGELISTYDSGISTRNADEKGNGDPFP